MKPTHLLPPLLWERRHVVLLTTLLLSLLIEPTLNSLQAHRVFYNAVFTLVMLAVFLFVFETRRDRWLSLVAAAPAITCGLVHDVAPADWQTMLNAAYHGFLVLFFGYAAGLILRGILERRAVRADDVLGAICSYLLLGLAWASVYQMIDILAPEAFQISERLAEQIAAHPHTRQSIFNYFSFCTLTTLGYGDVTPVNHLAAAFAWMEAMFGQFYIAVIVAQIIGYRMAMGGKHAERNS